MPEFDVETTLIINDSSLSTFVSNWVNAVDKVKRTATEAGAGLTGARAVSAEAEQQAAFGQVAAARDAGVIDTKVADAAMAKLATSFETLNAEAARLATSLGEAQRVQRRQPAGAVDDQGNKIGGRLLPHDQQAVTAASAREGETQAQAVRRQIQSQINEFTKQATTPGSDINIGTGTRTKARSTFRTLQEESFAEIGTAQAQGAYGTDPAVSAVMAKAVRDSVQGSFDEVAKTLNLSTVTQGVKGSLQQISARTPAANEASAQDALLREQRAIAQEAVTAAKRAPVVAGQQENIAFLQEQAKQIASQPPVPRPATSTGSQSTAEQIVREQVQKVQSQIEDPGLQAAQAELKRVQTEYASLTRAEITDEGLQAEAALKVVNARNALSVALMANVLTEEDLADQAKLKALRSGNDVQSQLLGRGIPLTGNEAADKAALTDAKLNETKQLRIAQLERQIALGTAGATPDAVIKDLKAQFDALVADAGGKTKVAPTPLTADQQLQADLAAKAAADARKLAVGAAQSGVTLTGGVDDRANVAAATKLQNQIAYNAVLEQQLANARGELDEIIRGKQLEAERNAKIKEALGTGGGGSSGGGIGGLLSGFGLSRGGGGGGGGFGSVVGGASEFALVFQLVQQGVGTFANLIKSAEATQVALAAVRSEVEQVNADTGSAGPFSVLNQSIKDTAASTGVAVPQVAQLSQEFFGLYGNVYEASQATSDAAKIITITGQSAATAGPQIAALAEDLNVSVKDIGNSVVDIQNKTGRLPADALAGISGLAAVAVDTGLSLGNIRGLIEAVGASSAKSGQQIGEGLGRVLPQLVTNAPKLAEIGVQFSAEAKGGDIAQMLTELIGQFGQLSKVTQEQIVALLGGPRNANILAGLFRDPKKALEEFNGTITNTNLLYERNSAIQDTTSQSFARLRQSVVSLGNDIVSSGIGQAFGDIAHDAGNVVSALGSVIGLFERFSKDTHGAVGYLIEFVLAFRAIKALADLNLFAKLFTGVENAGGIIQALKSIITWTLGLSAAEDVKNAATTREIGENITDTGTLADETVATEEATLATDELATARAAAAEAGGAGVAGAAVAGQLALPGLAAGTAPALAGQLPGLEVGGALMAGEGALVAPEALAPIAATGPAAIPIFVALAAAAAGKAAGAALKDYNNTKVKALLKQYGNETDAQLAVAAKDQTRIDPWGDTFRVSPPPKNSFSPITAGLSAITHFFLGSTPGSKGGLAVQVQRVRTLNAETDAINGIISAQAATPAQIKDLQDALAHPENKKKYDKAQADLAAIAKTAPGAEAINKATSDKTVSAAFDSLFADSAGTIKTVADAKAAFGAGQITQAQYIQALQTEINARTGFGDSGSKKVVYDDLKEQLKLVSDATLASVADQIQFAKDIMGNSDPNLAVAADLAALASSTLDPTARAALEKQTLANQRTAYDYNLAQAPTPAAILAQVQAGGPQISQAQADQINLDQINSGTSGGTTGRPLPFQAVADAEAKNKAAQLAIANRWVPGGPSYLGIAPHIAAEDRYAWLHMNDVLIPSVNAQAGADGAAAARSQNSALLQQQNAQAIADATLRRDSKAQIDALKLQGDQAELAATLAIDAAAFRYTAKDAATIAAEKALQLKVTNDQIALQATTDAATIALDAANTAFNVNTANAQSNPLAAAQAAAAGGRKKLADLQAQKAPADQIRQAQADLVSLNAAVVAQILAQSQAVYSLAEAQANAAGNPIGAAAAHVASILALITSLKAQGAPANSTAMLNAQGQLITAQAAYVQSQITTGENLIQTDITLHRITVGGAIERLKQLQQLATNQTQMDQIQMQIQQLETQAGSNLGFNISNINLPTLYEVRRLNATPAGVGYSDNRQFSIQLNIGSQLDLMGATNMLAQVVGVSSSRFGVAAQTR